MTTNTVIAFGLYETATKQDMYGACPDLQPFSDLTELRTGTLAARAYATFEPDFWLLDGEYKLKPSDSLTHVGLMSLSMSEGNGVFGTDPVLTLTFASSHATAGLTLRFMEQTNDYSNSLRVVYYSGASVVRTDDYAPESWRFSTGQAVASFNKIVITFYRTNKAYRHLRLTGLDFGNLTYFTGDEIRSAKLTEQVSPIALGLKSNTLEVNLISATADFSIVDPQGDYAELVNSQPLDVYEEVGLDTVYMGQFFLREWVNESDTEMLFKCVDRVGVLEGLPYKGNFWESATTIETILTDLLTAIKVPYEIDADLAGSTVLGWIPAMSYADAVKHIAFAIGGYVSCARSGAVQIKKTVLAAHLTEYDREIGKGEKGGKQSLSLQPLITGVEVLAYKYTAMTVDVIFSQYLAAGVHTIIFSAPARSVGIVGGYASISSKAANWAIVSVSISGTVSIQGELYDETQEIKGVYTSGLDASVPKNVVKVGGMKLVHAGNVSAVVNLVYGYYQQRYLQKAKLYGAGFLPAAGSSVLIDSLQNRQIGGIVERMVIDLSGGFTAQAEVLGVVV
jgi:hypothetical protein